MARKGGAFKPVFLLSEEEGLAIIAEEAPELPRSVALNLLWNATGFPEFWSIGEDGATPAECCRKQVREAIREGGMR